MKKPDAELSELVFGKIFQINPEGKDPVQVQFGGDFLIATQYFERGVMGYLACASEQEGMTRFKGRAYLMVEWKYLELVGSVEWFKEREKDGESNSNKD